MNFLSLISGILPAATVWLFLHPIHVSVTEIEFDEKDETLEIMMRVFIDDLELTLRNSLDKPGLDILKAGTASVDQMMGDYLNHHFRISLDDRPKKTTYLGHEREGEAFIFYIEVQDVKRWRTITIHNDIIMGTYDDQSNIVHVFVRDDVKSLRLTRNKPADKLSFD